MRTVKVDLEADVGAFKLAMDSAGHSVEALARDVEKLDDKLDDIPPDAAQAALALKLLAGDVGSVGSQLGTIDQKSAALTVLERRVADARAEVKKLGEEFMKTGDIDVFHQLGKAQGNLRGLENMKKSLKQSIEDGMKDGLFSGEKLMGDLGKLFSGEIAEGFSNPYVLGAAAALAVALGAFVGAAIGGAVIAAGALGVVGAGAVGAFMVAPEQMRSAWTDVLDGLKQKFKDASGVFVQPMLDAAKTLKAQIGNIDFTKMFQTASKFVAPLAEATGWFLRNIIDGVDYLVQAGAPVIEVLRQELPELGASIEEMFRDIAGGNKGAADGLRDLLNVLETTIEVTGVIIGTTSAIYHNMVQARDAVGDFFDVLNDNVPVVFALADKLANIWPDEGTEHHLNNLKEVSEETQNLAKAAEDAAQQVQQINDAFDQLGQSAVGAFTSHVLDSMFALDHATLSFQDSLLKLTKSVDDNGTSLNTHTEKGLANAQAILGAAEANAKLYEENLKSGMAADQAAAAYAKGTSDLKSQAAAAGFSAAQVQNLIGKYDNVPARVQTLLATIGLTDALNHLAQILVDFRNLNGKAFASKYTVTTEYRVIHTGSVGGKEGPDKYAKGGIRHAAQGLIVAPSDPGSVMFGEPETGGEAFIPLRGITQRRAMDLATTVGQAYGFNVVSRQGGNSGGVNVSVGITATGGMQGFAAMLQEMQRKGMLQFVVKGG